LGSGISKMWTIFAPGYRSRDTAHAQRYACSPSGCYGLRGIYGRLDSRRFEQKNDSQIPRNRGRRSEWRGQIFDRKLQNSCFCACSV